jgi:hypothetical protein
MGVERGGWCLGIFFRFNGWIDCVEIILDRTEYPVPPKHTGTDDTNLPPPGGSQRDVVAEAYTTQPNSKASSRVLYNIFESTCGGVTVITHV